jgi:hypothetical protein
VIQVAETFNFADSDVAKNGRNWSILARLSSLERLNWPYLVECYISAEVA